MHHHRGTSLEQKRLFLHWLTATFASLCGCLADAALAEKPGDAPHVQLRPVTVTGTRHDIHDVASEAERVGPANQPEWTARRAFAETDIYVIPPGEFEFNQFYVFSQLRHERPEHQFETEFEFGLPWRTQFDVELIYNATGGQLTYDATQLEIPHALADWGKIPLNPALDAGWRFNAGEDDAYFFRLLLAEEFSPRVHFGANLAFDRQIGGELETGYELNVALNYVALDTKLAIGAELLVEYETEREEEAAGESEWLHSTTVMLGPSLLYRPTRHTHLALVPMFGLTRESPTVEAFFIFGLDLELFGGGESGDKSERVRPLRRLK